MSLQEIALDETTCSGNELLQEQSFEQKSRKLFWILGRRVRSTLMLQDFQIGKEYELYEDGDKLAKVRVITPPHKTKNGTHEMHVEWMGGAVLRLLYVAGVWRNSNYHPACQYGHHCITHAGPIYRLKKLS